MPKLKSISVTRKATSGTQREVRKTLRSHSKGDIKESKIEIASKSLPIGPLSPKTVVNDTQGKTAVEEDIVSSKSRLTTDQFSKATTRSIKRTIDDPLPLKDLESSIVDGPVGRMNTRRSSLLRKALYPVTSLSSAGKSEYLPSHEVLQKNDNAEVKSGSGDKDEGEVSTLPLSPPPPTVPDDDNESSESESGSGSSSDSDSNPRENGSVDEMYDEVGEQSQKSKLKLPGGAPRGSQMAPKSLHKYKRRRRCGECTSCLIAEDCGNCVFCLDKPKFGGPNIKKQACIVRRCLNLKIPTKPPPHPPKRYPQDGHTGYLPHVHSKRRPNDIIDVSSKKSKYETGSLSSVHPSGVVRGGHKHSLGVTLLLYWPEGLHNEKLPVYNASDCDGLPLCVACGSRGLSPLLVCRTCGSQYHWFCVGVAKEHTFFICSNCQICHTCGGADKLMECASCHKTYHKSCCVRCPKSSTPHSKGQVTGVWRCTHCVQCINCKRGSDGVEEWHENFTLCPSCYELKKKGNYCPLCMYIYDDNDFDSKMVQCTTCNHWIHSHCEDMTDEEYEILSELPEEEVVFSCRKCEPPSVDAPWRKAIQDEMLGGIKGVFSQFSKQSWSKVLLNADSMEMPSFCGISDRISNQTYSSVDRFVCDMIQVLERMSTRTSSGEKLHLSVVKAKELLPQYVKDHFLWFEMSSNLMDTAQPPPDDPLDTAQPLPKDHKDNTADEELHVMKSSLMDHSYCCLGDQPSLNIDVSSSNTVPHPPDTVPRPPDTRACVLCSKKGDGGIQGCGRLLPCGVSMWIHIHCAYWSAEVYELTHLIYRGVLFDVHAAISRGRSVRCEVCQETGATIGCCSSKCQKSFHFSCAREAGCVFLKTRQVYCSEHAELGTAGKEVVADLSFGTNVPYMVNMNPNKQYKRLISALSPNDLSMKSGSLCVHFLGELCPLSDTRERLIPNRFKSSCLFWDLTNPGALGEYTLTVEIVLDSEDEEIEVEFGTSDPRLDDPTLSFSTITADHTSSSEGEGPAKPEDEDSSTSAQISSLSKVIEQNSKCSSLHRPGQVKSLLHSKIVNYKIPKRSSRNTSETDTPSRLTDTPTQTMDTPNQALDTPTVTSPMLLNYLAGLPLHKEGIYYSLSGPGGLLMRGTDLQDLWSSVVARVQALRAHEGLEPLFSNYMSAYQQFGLDNSLVTRLVEQLPKAENCTKYHFKYFNPPKMGQWEHLKRKHLINPSGCARSETYKGRKPIDMFGFLMSEHLPPPPEPDPEALIEALEEAPTLDPKFRPGNVKNLPMAMRYRIMLRNLKDNLSVHRSHIHGLGLYAKKTIDAGDMVVEYAGTLIRSVLTDKREKYYDEKGMGTYMFRIDSDDVVDATMSGNEARFINHSCDPNCYSRIITVDGKKKIMIFAARRIVPGEELTYDYKFPLEEKKIPCSCGARLCRKFLN